MNGYTGEGSIDDVGDIEGQDLKDIARDKLIYATGWLRTVEAKEIKRPNEDHEEASSSIRTRFFSDIGVRMHQFPGLS